MLAHRHLLVDVAASGSRNSEGPRDANEAKSFAGACFSFLLTSPNPVAYSCSPKSRSGFVPHLAALLMRSINVPQTFASASLSDGADCGTNLFGLCSRWPFKI